MSDEFFTILAVVTWFGCGAVGYCLVKAWWKKPNEHGWAPKWTNTDRMFHLFLAVVVPWILLMAAVFLWTISGIGVVCGKDWWEKEASW